MNEQSETALIDKCEQEADDDKILVNTEAYREWKASCYEDPSQTGDARYETTGMVETREPLYADVSDIPPSHSGTVMEKKGACEVAEDDGMHEEMPGDESNEVTELMEKMTPLYINVSATPSSQRRSINTATSSSQRRSINTAGEDHDTVADSVM